MLLLESKAILTHMNPFQTFTLLHIFLYLGFILMLSSHLFLSLQIVCFFQLFRLTYLERICHLILFVSLSTVDDSLLLSFSSSSTLSM